MKGKLDFLYQDEHLVVLNKQAGYLSIPDRFVPEKPNLVHQLESVFGKIWVIHRLDKETSGAICFALDAETHRALSIQFEHREVEKLYHVLVDGQLSQDHGEIDRPIAPHPTISGKMIASAKGKPAKTLYQIHKSYKDFTLLEADIKTGRTHQIRVHFSSIGFPLTVDPLYGRRSSLALSEIKKRNFRLGKNQEERPLMKRLSLHAASLKIKHPHSGEVLKIEAPYHKDFRAVLQQMDKWNAYD